MASLSRMIPVMAALVVALAAMAAQGRASGKPAVKSADGRYDYTDVRINRYNTEQTIEEVWQRLAQEKKEGKLELEPIQFIGFSNKINYYAQYPEIEQDAKLSRTWLLKLVAILKEMHKARLAMEYSAMANEAAKANAAKAAYIRYFEAFQALKDKPERLDSDRPRR